MLDDAVIGGDGRSTQRMESRWRGKVKVKVNVESWICIAPRREHISKVLRYGTCPLTEWTIPARILIPILLLLLLLLLLLIIITIYLKPTTHECVHLVTHSYSQSRSEDDGNAIRSTVAKKTMRSMQTSPVYVLQKLSYWRWNFHSAEAKLSWHKVLRCGNTHCRLFCSCDLDLDPMTFTY